jgi:hypothetical protein
VSAKVLIEKVMADADPTEGEASAVVRTKADSTASSGHGGSAEENLSGLCRCSRLYQSNGDFTISDDATGKASLPVRLLTRVSEYGTLAQSVARTWPAVGRVCCDRIKKPLHDYLPW